MLKTRKITEFLFSSRKLLEALQIFLNFLSHTIKGLILSYPKATILLYRPRILTSGNEQKGNMWFLDFCQIWVTDEQLRKKGHRKKSTLATFKISWPKVMMFDGHQNPYPSLPWTKKKGWEWLWFQYLAMLGKVVEVWVNNHKVKMPNWKSLADFIVIIIIFLLMTLR